MCRSLISTASRGKFDMGWDKFRELVFANQKKLGVVPESAKLSARPEELAFVGQPKCRSEAALPRQMEVFAGFMVQTDEQIGRVIDTVRQLLMAIIH